MWSWAAYTAACLLYTADVYKRQIWKLPIIFVCENNHYGISMSQDRHQAIKDVADRGAAYNIPGIAVDGNDPLAVYERCV